MITSLILLFITLAFLEIMLSGDNAVVLASIAAKLKDPKDQTKALNIGIIGSYVLRCLVIIFGVWMFNNPVIGPAVKFIGAAYLLYLFWDFFWGSEGIEDGEEESEPTLTNAILTIMFADLAFSLDSGTTALALSDNIYVILGACATGVLALRFLAGLFVKLIKEYTNLEAAGYIAVGFVGLQLLLKTFTSIVITESLDVGIIISIFLWGFSMKNPDEVDV